MRFSVLALVLSVGLVPVGAMAQDSQTLADVRQELTILYVEMQKLRRELSTTGAATVDTSGSSTLDRLASMETELQRLTGKTEQLEFRINEVVRDGTNRIGDLEFRLVELEGGDVSKLGETTTLGGSIPAPAPAVSGTATPAAPTDTSELAVGERSDFEAASAALTSGDFRAAADQFEAFNQVYPGGPLAAEASLKLGYALNGLDETRDAARAFLKSFSAAPTGAVAPDALFHLGKSLGALEQSNEACATLREVGVRFPDASVVPEASAELQALNCP